MKSTSPICVDASFVVRLVVSDAQVDVVPYWRAWLQDGRKIIAPRLLLYEVANAMFQYMRHEILTLSEAGVFFEEIQRFPITLIDDPNLHFQAIVLASRYRLHAAYDAHYLALAQRLNAEFWTCDRRLADKVSKIFPWVHLA